MEIKNCNQKTKCEINGCKNLANFTIHRAMDSKVGINICENCAHKMYSCLGRINIPKSIPAPFKNQKRIRMESK